MNQLVFPAPPVSAVPVRGRTERVAIRSSLTCRRSIACKQEM